MLGSVFLARTSSAKAPSSSRGAPESRWTPSSGVSRSPRRTLSSTSDQGFIGARRLHRARRRRRGAERTATAARHALVAVRLLLEPQRFVEGREESGEEVGIVDRPRTTGRGTPVFGALASDGARGPVLLLGAELHR